MPYLRKCVVIHLVARAKTMAVTFPCPPSAGHVSPTVQVFLHSVLFFHPLLPLTWFRLRLSILDNCDSLPPASASALVPSNPQSTPGAEWFFKMPVPEGDTSNRLPGVLRLESQILNKAHKHPAVCGGPMFLASSLATLLEASCSC